MSAVSSFLGSSIGKKILMAVTGFILFLFVIEHLIGNLLVYAGPKWLDAYGGALKVQALTPVLWGARIVLLLCVFVHMWAALMTTLGSWKARPQKYAETDRLEADWAGLTMRWGGLLILLFVIWHLMDLTFGNVTPGFAEGRVYHNVITTFSRPGVAVFYILAMVFLGLHLYHGIWSGLQTLGLSSPRFNTLRKGAALVFALVIVLGNISIPISVMTGFLKDVPPSAATARK
jgi:succinate dehydrogenase / fumarate reductase cytochrome b subunit